MADEEFACPRCLRISHNPVDAYEGYCSYCHDWTRHNPRRTHLITDLIELGEPDDQYGYTGMLLRSKFDEQQWRRFLVWHAGQTGCVNDAGMTVYFEADVERFLRAGKIID